jgi:hypothetical protein
MGFFSFGTGAGEAKGVMKDQQAKQNAAWQSLQAYLEQLRSSMSPYLEGAGEGYNPLQLALTKSSFLNNAAGKYANANSAVKTALLRRGSAGNGPVGGDYTRGIAALEGSQADTVSNGIRDIDMSNLEQALKNKFMAAGVMSGNANQMNAATQGFGSGVANALNTYTHSLQNGFGGQFMNNLGASLGKGIGQNATRPTGF